MVSNQLIYKINKFIYLDKNRDKFKKIFATVTMMILSFFLAIFFVCTVCQKWTMLGKIFEIIFKESFKGTAKINILLSNMGILIVASLSFIISNKANLFNMGISGQLMCAATVSTLISHFCHLGHGTNQIVIFLLGLVIGAILSATIGIIKVFLNVNEVVSSIMLNWIIYFLTILILKTYVPQNSSNNFTKPIDNPLLFRAQLSNQYFAFIPIIIIATCLVGFVYLFLNYTTIGKKQCLTGLNIKCAKAMGYNTKMNLIISMTISGAIAGILGNLIYCGFSCEMPTSTIVKVIPQEGFDGIAVGLISMNNPLAIIPVSLFFSIIKTSTSALQLIGISSNITLIFLGIIIYCSAMGSLLMKFNFYNWFIVKIKGKSWIELKTKEKNELLSLINIVNDYEVVMWYHCQRKNNSNSSKMPTRNKKLKKEKISHVAFELKFDQIMEKIKNNLDPTKIKNKFYHAYVLTKKNIKIKYLKYLQNQKKNLEYNENKYPIMNFLENFKLLLNKKD